jgi:ABC-type antimicrobial peptide transport system permease subunit
MQLIYQKILEFRDLSIFGEITINNLASEIRSNVEDLRIYSFKQNLKVTHVGNMIGTFGNKNSFFILLNKKHFFDSYIDQIKNNKIKDEITFMEGEKKHTIKLLDELAKVKDSEMSNAIIFNFKERMNIYLHDSYKAIQSQVLPQANRLLSALDITDMVYTSTPIVNQLNSLKYVVPFMKITINTLIAFLLLLNFTLIYHIFGLSLKDKLSHFGIMRTQGFPKSRLYFVLFAQGLFLSFITFVIAFPLTLLLFATFNSMDLQIQLFENNIYPTPGIFFLTLFLNFLVPQVSLLVPGYKFFSKKIMESIDNRAELFSSLKLTNNKNSNIFSKIYNHFI